MSTVTENVIEEVVAKATPDKKVRKPTLNAKSTLLMTFGYNFIEELEKEGLITDASSAYNMLNMFSPVEEQIEYYKGFLENVKDSTKSMKQMIKDVMKPPKAPKAPRKKAEKKEVLDENGNPVEKPKRGRKKKEVVVESSPENDNNDYVAQLVESAQTNTSETKKPKKITKITVEAKPSPVVEEPKVEETKVEETKAEKPKAEKKPKEEKPKAEKKTKDTKKSQVVVPTPEPEPEPVKTETNDDEDEVVQARELIVDGKTYLLGEDNTVYDQDTCEEIGTFNPDTQSIDFN